MSTGEFAEARLDRMHDVMAGYVEGGVVPGIVTLVSRRGEAHVDVIGTKAFGGSDPMRRDTIFRVASVTKPIVAAAAMILVEECALGLDEPVDQWLPELADLRGRPGAGTARARAGRTDEALRQPAAGATAGRGVVVRQRLRYPWSPDLACHRHESGRLPAAADLRAAGHARYLVQRAGE